MDTHAIEQSVKRRIERICRKLGVALSQENCRASKTARGEPVVTYALGAAKLLKHPKAISFEIEKAQGKEVAYSDKAESLTELSEEFLELLARKIADKAATLNNPEMVWRFGPHVCVRDAESKMIDGVLYGADDQAYIVCRLAIQETQDNG